MWLDSEFGGRASISSRLLYTTLLVLFGINMLLGPPFPYVATSLSLVLFSPSYTVLLSVPFLFHTFIYWSVKFIIANCCVSPTMYVYITQTALNANIYCNQSLVLFKVSGNTVLLLISNILLPSHRDLVAGQHLWEQDPQGLQAAAHWHGMTILISSPAEQVFWAAAATTLMTGLYSAMMLLWAKQQCFHTCLLWVLHPTVVSGCHRLESSDLTGSWG